MDGNKDQSEECYNKSQEFLSRRNFKKAQWFATKAHHLYPTERTKELLEKTTKLLDENQDEEENSESNNSESSNQRETTNETSSNEQSQSVDYIKHCKDYYEILRVSKTATEVEIKQQYKRLALQFHPDKNKSPGAVETFKAISAAFTVLSNPEKRREYDERGSDDYSSNGLRSRRRGSYDYSRGFDEDFNAEEIFNMFFGRGFFPGQNVYVYRSGGGGGGARHYSNRSTRVHQNTNESQTNAGYTVLLQIMPILFFICISLLSNFVPDNPYSLTRSHKYPYQRFTENFQVPYFVKENFERDYKDTIQQIESHVEETYISNLQTACFKERNYKENLIYRAKFLRDSALESKAQTLRTPSCDKLVQIEKSYYS